MPLRERIAVLDVIRGWVLLGVLIANIHEVIGGRLYGAAPADAVLDSVATWFITAPLTRARIGEARSADAS